MILCQESRKQRHLRVLRNMYCHSVELSRRFCRFNFCRSARYRGSHVTAASKATKRRRRRDNFNFTVLDPSPHLRIADGNEQREYTGEYAEAKEWGRTHYAFTCWEECDSSSGRGGATLKDEKRTRFKWLIIARDDAW